MTYNSGTQGKIKVAPNTTGFQLTLDASGLTVDRTYTGQNSDGTLAFLTDIPAAINYDFVNNEVVSGSGTSFTLADTPISSDSVCLYGRGQRLTPTVDFSLTGTAITTVNSWATGDILADYRITI